MVDGIPCTDGLQTLLDLAADLNDLEWEQALESGLRKGLTTIDALECGRRELSASRTPGAARVRRVLGQRPAQVPPTESLLETLMVQLIRTIDDLPEPVRQFEVHDEHGGFVARVDLCFPDIGMFLELDGQQHKDQPVYDSTRETAVVATTGWLPGRFTWREVAHLQRTTARRLTGIARQARRRAGASGSDVRFPL